MTHLVNANLITMKRMAIVNYVIINVQFAKMMVLLVLNVNMRIEMQLMIVPA